MPDWKTVKVGDLGRVVTGKTPKTAEKDNYGGPVPFLTPSDDMDAKHVFSTGKTLTPKGAQSVKGAIIPPNSVCVSCIGSDLGKVVITTALTVTNQQINSIVVNTDMFDVDFVYYAMLILGKKLNYHSKASTAVPIINKSVFSNYEIKCPSLALQRRISRILSTLDEKIEKNQRMNANLIEQALAIFDYEFAGLPDEKPVGEYIIPKRGKGLLSKNAVPGVVPVVAGGLEPSTFHNVSNTKSPVITISASGANAGFVNLWHVPVWSSDSSYIDASMTNDVYFWYVFLKRHQKEIFDSQTGSAQPHVYPQHIAGLQMPNLSSQQITIYTNKVAPLFELISKNKQEITHLITVREMLLPRLVSGELDISDADI